MSGSRGFASTAAFLLVQAWASVTWAGVSEQVPIGPRALGMGGAFSAIADDASAMFWNPAGLCHIPNNEVSGSYANLYQSDIKDNFLVGVFPLTERQAIGVDWYHSGLEDTELRFAENRLDVAYAVSPWKKLYLGATVKYLNRDIALDGTPQRQGYGFGADLGVLLLPTRSLRLALVGQDMTNTRLTYGEKPGGLTPAFPRNTRVAMAYNYGRFGTAALDIDDRYHMGVEVRPLSPLSLRGGLQVDRAGDEDPSYSFGAGFEAKSFRLDYAYLIHPVLDATSYIGISYAFRFSAARIRIEKPGFDDIYASMYKSYANTPSGHVEIQNLEQEPIQATIRVGVVGLTETPADTTIMLRPGVKQTIPLTISFSEQIMKATDRPIQFEIATTDLSQRVPRTTKMAVKGMLYGPGGINWSRGMDQAASFVTPRDPLVADLSRHALQAVSHREGSAPGLRSLSHVAAIFDALQVLGVTYVPDPLNPFASVSEKSGTVDTVHYPRETLSRKSGDCDDTSVLLASLLANVGIRTKLVDVPGHVFLLVDTGLSERYRMALGVAEDKYVVADEKVWIPLETTAIVEGFAEAWNKGALAYQSQSVRGELTLIDLAEAQTRFPSADPPIIRETPIAVDTSLVSPKVRADEARIAEWRAEFLKSHYDKLPRDAAPTVSALNELARLYHLGGDEETAEARLRQILDTDPRSVTGRNNLGVVLAARANLDEAVAAFREAERQDPRDPGISLNLALTSHLRDRSAASWKTLAEAVHSAGGEAEACRILGVRAEEDLSGRGFGSDADDAVVKGILALIRGAARISPAGPADGRTAPSIESATRPAEGPDLQALKPDLVARYLYWKV